MILISRMSCRKPLQLKINFIVLTALLSSCGEGSSETPLPVAAAPTTTKVGYLRFASSLSSNEAEGQVSTSAYGRFQGYDTKLTDSELERVTNSISEMRSPGCSISIDWEDDYKGQYYVPPPPESHPLKAGEALSVLTPAGSWPDVLLQDQYISYRFVTNVSGSIPAASTVSVPGAEFPSFIQVPIPHVKQIENMTISLGQQEYLGRETKLGWQPGTDPNAYISIQFAVRAMSLADTYEGEESYSYWLDVSCIANDSGLFEYPEDTWEIVSAHEVSPQNLRIKRISQNVVSQGDSLLLIDSTHQLVDVFGVLELN